VLLLAISAFVLLLVVINILCVIQSWEGGSRVIGVVGGGFMDPANAGGVTRRPLGSRLEGVTHGVDW
jgi:hypothetical protein